MHIIYISYWGINEGLCESAVLPHLNIISENERVNKISFMTFERGQFECTIQNNKIIHYPIIEKRFPKGFNKVLSMRFALKKLKEIIKNEKVDLIIAKSSLAGILGSKIYDKYKIPYIVESFEPHVEYMVESGEWKKNSIKALTLKKYEKQIKNTAFKLFTVAHNYKDRLIKEGVDPNKVKVVPCSVNFNDFCFIKADRVNIREQLKIKETTKVGIYVGKFGGIYLAEEAFYIFKKCFEAFNNDFFLILLSPNDPNEIKKYSNQANISINNLLHLKVNHNEVAKYLSASDFAFSMQKPKPSNAFLNPLKIGEYWANGLPIYMTAGVGDDDAIIRDNKIGVLFEQNYQLLNQSIIELKNILNTIDNIELKIREKIVLIAKKYRSFDINRQQFNNLIDEIYEQNKS